MRVCTRARTTFSFVTMYMVQGASSSNWKTFSRFPTFYFPNVLPSRFPTFYLPNLLPQNNPYAGCSRDARMQPELGLKLQGQEPERASLQKLRVFFFSPPCHRTTCTSLTRAVGESWGRESLRKSSAGRQQALCNLG